MKNFQSEPSLDVTVALLLHGDPPQIREVVQAILSQEFARGAISILCLDDGTSPRAAATLKQLPVRVVRVPPDSSISHAKNVALRLATDEFVFFLDDHLTLEPGGIAAAMDVFQKDPELAGVCGFYRSAKTSDWNILRDIKRHSIYGKATRPRTITLEEFTTFSTGIGIVRRSVFLHLGFPEDDFPPDFGGEDTPALVEALNRGLRFAYEPKLSGLHEHNLTSIQFLRKIEIEVRGRFSVFYWASGRPELRVPYLHGYLNFPLFLYVALLVFVPASVAWGAWALLVPCGFLALEVFHSLRCLSTSISYPLRLRLLATLYVLGSDLLTPLCGIQYLVSSYRRPYASLGLRRGLAMIRMFAAWELSKAALGLRPRLQPRSGHRPVESAASRLIQEPEDAA